MKINIKISFGMMLVASLLSGFYFQSQIGNKDTVNKFFADVSIKSKELIEVNFPKDLIVNVDKGELTINKKLPYCFLIDKEKNEGIVFDSATSPNIASFKETPKNFGCKPMVLVGKNYVAVANNDTENRIYNIPPEISVTVDQKFLIENKDKYLPVVETQGKKLYDVLPYLLMILIIPGVMLGNLWYSVVVWLLGKIFKLSAHPEFKNRYWIALFFGSILTIVNLLLQYMQYSQISFAFSGSIIIGGLSVAYLKLNQYNATPIDETVETPVEEVKTVKVTKKKSK